MSTCRYIIGDVFDVLADMPDNSVDLVITSPPFLALRSYLPADHPNKHKEIGSEPDPAAFIDTLLELTAEWDRVLTRTGSICVELGDTYCVDTETEALTRSGWKSHDEIEPGDEVLAIDETGISVWSMVRDVSRFAGTHRMLSLEGRGHSSLTTANHRWWTERRRGGNANRSWVREWATSEKLMSEHRIPIAAPHEAPNEAKWSDAFVEAVAWYWTEGHDRKPSKGRTQHTGVYIVQSSEVNPDHCTRIRRCLAELWGPPVDRLPGVKGAGPCWTEYNYRGDKAEFRLNAAAARILREAAPMRVVRSDWLAELTGPQIEMFVQVSVWADGHERNGSIELAQKERARAEAFQIALVLSGRGASLYQDGNGRWVAQGRLNSRMKPMRYNPKWIEHEGVVWCPTTDHGSWLARRNGRVFFTGNSGSGGAGGDYNEDGLREGQNAFAGSASRHSGDAWPEKKSACLIPELYRVALAYGINPITGAESPAGRWRVRNTVRWVRPNPPVGALGDKYRPATSDMVIACKASDRWFDLDAVRQPLAAKTLTVKDGTPPSAKNQESPTGSHKMDRLNNPAGAPPLDWWKISPGGYPGSHYAVFPPELVEVPIQSMCPREVCTVCAEPRRRITTDPVGDGGDKSTDGLHRDTSGQGHHGHRVRAVDTIGWSVCDCETPSYRPGIVLDPFGGSGTTGAVATGYGRDAVLIDIDESNADLAVQRIGMFCAVETHQPT